MREYSKIAPQFWNGKTGKALKAKGPEAVMVALYLLTCPHANMLGLYYVSKTYIAVDTGLPFEGASKGLQWACEAGFCAYDEDSEIVWVKEMAAYQIADQLEAKDNRCKGIQKEYDALPENPYLRAFHDKYAGAFHMTSCRESEAKTVSPLEAPSKPRARTGAGTGFEESKDSSSASASRPARKAVDKSKPDSEKKNSLVWEAYATAYAVRYGSEPPTSAKNFAHCRQIVERVGIEEAPGLCAWYVKNENMPYYVSRGHPLDSLVKDCDGMLVRMRRGQGMTRKEAGQADEDSSRSIGFKRAAGIANAIAGDEAPPQLTHEKTLEIAHKETVF